MAVAVAPGGPEGRGTSQHAGYIHDRWRDISDGPVGRALEVSFVNKYNEKFETYL